jgi:uncharacterized protein
MKNLVQVCYDLNSDNLDRELNGLMEVMEFFGLKQRIIVTGNHGDHYERNGMKVTVTPAYDYLANG